MTNVRRSTKGLNTNQVRELNYAWQHATNIGRPLNAFITIRPIDIDSTPPTERCRLFAAVRNKLGVYARLRRFGPLALGACGVHRLGWSNSRGNPQAAMPGYEEDRPAHVDWRRS